MKNEIKEKNGIMNIFLITSGILLLLILSPFLFALPIMWFVNYLFTPHVLMMVIGTPHMGFWQALVLGILCNLLFKSFNTNNK